MQGIAVRARATHPVINYAAFDKAKRHVFAIYGHFFATARASGFVFPFKLYRLENLEKARSVRLRRKTNTVHFWKQSGIATDL